jgi:hypothetical protein
VTMFHSWQPVYLYVAILLVLAEDIAISPMCLAFVSAPTLSHHRLRFSSTRRYNWFDELFPQLNDPDSEADRLKFFPEQYSATYDLSSVVVPSDGPDAKLVRPLLKQTLLEQRPLQLAYDANRQGWNPRAFHQCVDGKGGAFVLATGQTFDGPITVGGYNAKGWSSNGGARPSVASFLMYSKPNQTFQKLRKVGGGGLACARDDPDFGIAFGPDGLVIGLQPGKERVATSKLGPYYERGPEELPSLFGYKGGAIRLDTLKVLVGVYDKDEDIPYSGAVLDMTSG